MTEKTCWLKIGTHFDGEPYLQSVTDQKTWRDRGLMEETTAAVIELKIDFGTAQVRSAFLKNDLYDK